MSRKKRTKLYGCVRPTTNYPYRIPRVEGATLNVLSPVEFIDLVRRYEGRQDHNGASVCRLIREKIIIPQGEGEEERQEEPRVLPFRATIIVLVFPSEDHDDLYGARARCRE